jgi:hypothetical protein
VQEAIAALEAALGELERARDELSDDLRDELTKIMEEARALLESLRSKSDD